MAFEKSSPPIGSSPSAVCQHLRSKGMYITGSMNPEVDDPEVGDGHCWCNQTQYMLGPDQLLVSREDCTPQRTCFRPSAG